VDLMRESAAAHRTRVKECFAELASSNMMGQDLVGTMLLRIGHREVRADWVEELVRATTLGRYHLDLDDAVELAQQYRERFVRDVESHLCNGDLSALCPSEAADQMLRTLSTHVLPGVKTKALTRFSFLPQVASKKLDDGDRGLTQIAQVEDIMRMRDSIVDHAGFLPEEYRRIQAIFSRYDQDQDGWLTSKEVRLALTWIGASAEYARAATTSARYKETRFIEIIKEFFELEEERIEAAFTAADENKNALIERCELPAFFEQLGCLAASQEVIDEAVESCGLTLRQVFNMEDIYLVFMRYRERNGFLQAELTEMREAFKALDHDSSESMDATELETAVHWLGYPSSYAKVAEALEACDIDESGEVELDEIAIFVGRYRDAHIAQVNATFAEAAAGSAEVDQRGLQMPVSAIRSCLHELGFVNSGVRLQNVTRGLKEIPPKTFGEIVRMCRREVAAKARINECFAVEEVLEFQGKFQEYANKDGEITNESLPSLLEALYPDIRKNHDSHARAKSLIGRADMNSDGKIEWAEFLRMMRLFRYEVRRDQIAKEREAVLETGFSKEEVEEFRSVFDTFDQDASDGLDPEEFGAMWQTVEPALATRASAAKDLLHQVWDSVQSDSHRSFRFPEFLKLMRAVAEETECGERG